MTLNIFSVSLNKVSLNRADYLNNFFKFSIRTELTFEKFSKTNRFKTIVLSDVFSFVERMSGLIIYVDQPQREWTFHSIAPIAIFKLAIVKAIYSIHNFLIKFFPFAIIFSCRLLKNARSRLVAVLVNSNWESLERAAKSKTVSSDFSVLFRLERFRFVHCCFTRKIRWFPFTWADCFLLIALKSFGRCFRSLPNSTPRSVFINMNFNKSVALLWLFRCPLPTLGDAISVWFQLLELQNNVPCLK